MDEDLKILIPEDKFLKVGKKRFKIWISGGKLLRATNMFNKLNAKDTDEHKALKTDFDVYSAWIDICLFLIRRDFVIMMKQHFSIKTVIDWIRQQLLTKKYLLNNMAMAELTDFVDTALEPIIGTKKKELEREQKAAEAMMILMDQITPEALAKLLRNSLQTADTPKAM
ncbi:MAG: hypothetical protein GY804_13920 [Alphaproteobacteria bacterium]|nr:hypothetical protein [Alphaproteobacteria bacterium]